jgi:hypothetical protein
MMMGLRQTCDQIQRRCQRHQSMRSIAVLIAASPSGIADAQCILTSFWSRFMSLSAKYRAER